MFGKLFGQKEIASDPEPGPRLGKHSRGPVQKHGHTFGGLATEKYRVEHTISTFRNGEPVIRLHVP